MESDFWMFLPGFILAGIGTASNWYFILKLHSDAKGSLGFMDCWNIIYIASYSGGRLSNEVPAFWSKKLIFVRQFSRTLFVLFFLLVNIALFWKMSRY